MRARDRDRSSRADMGRRGLLTIGACAAAAGLAGGSGCDLLRPGPTPVPSPDPLEPLLAGTVTLVTRYDAALARRPELAARLTPLRDAHLTHVAALAALIGRSPPAIGASTPPTPATSSAAPSEVPDILAGLRGAEQAAQRAAAAVCLAAPARRAGLLGAIAACRATHVEVLR